MKFGRSLLIVLAITLIDEPLWRLVYICIVLGLYTACLLSFRPFYTHIGHYNELCGSLGAILVLNAALPWTVLGSGGGFVDVLFVTTYVFAAGFVIVSIYVTIMGFKYGFEKFPIEAVAKDLGGRTIRKMKLPTTGKITELISGVVDTAPDDTAPKEGMGSHVTVWL
jgi:hypothetical protein